MNFLFDTSAIIIYLKSQFHKELIDKKFAPLSDTNTAILSVVTLGELKSMIIRNKWGSKRVENLEKFLNKFLITDINSKDVIDAYGEIDAFSQNKIDSKPLNMTARNMGKNDLWIAATAHVTDSTILTSDKDFQHLDKTYLSLALIEV